MIISRLRAWLGDENVRYFQLLKSLTGSYSPVLALNVKRKGIPVYNVHLHEGMQIRNWMRDQPEFEGWDAIRLDNYWQILVGRMCNHYRSKTWVKLENKYDSYPSEGIEVIASDDEGNEAQLYFLMSSEYVWMKVDKEADDANEFTDFIPTKWKVLD